MMPPLSSDSLTLTGFKRTNASPQQQRVTSSGANIRTTLILHEEREPILWHHTWEPILMYLLGKQELYCMWYVISGHPMYICRKFDLLQHTDGWLPTCNVWKIQTILLAWTFSRFSNIPLEKYLFFWVLDQKNRYF